MLYLQILRRVAIAAPRDLLHVGVSRPKTQNGCLTSYLVARSSRTRSLQGLKGYRIIHSL